jgi:hypothetical protein
MAEVIDLIADSLAGRDDIVRIEDGYSKAGPGMHYLASTKLTFRRLPGSGGDAPLLAVATVETRFEPVDWGEEGVAWVNRRAAMGTFLREDGGVICRLVYPLYRRDPDARSVANYLLAAFEQQVVLGYAINAMDRDGRNYQFWRSRISCPRLWTTPLPASAFGNLAVALQQYGRVTALGPSGVVMDVSLVEAAAALPAVPDADAARISIRTDVQHPLAGTGYCATLTLPRAPSRELLPQRCTQLNAIEHRQADFAPRLGAWGMRDLCTQIVYGMFWPTDRASTTAVTKVAHWMVRRALWIRRSLWMPGSGLSLSEED